MDALAARWLDRAPDAWGELVAGDPAATAAHRPELWAAFLAASPALEARIAVVEEAGRLVGGACVMLERRAGFEWLHALPMLLPAPPLARAGRHAEVDRAVARAIDALARERRIVGGEWSLYRPVGPPVADDALAATRGETRMLEAAIVDVSRGLDAALQRVDRKQRRALRPAAERPLTFRAEPALLEGAYALYLAQGRQWRGHRALPLELSRRLLHDAPGGPVARLFSLSDAQGVVSATLALDSPAEVFLWWSGTHADGRRRGAFPLLLWSIVEWAAAAGRARVNLGASTGLSLVASFKHSLGAEARAYPVRWLDARAATLPARALAWAQRFVRRGRPRGAAA